MLCFRKVYVCTVPSLVARSSSAISPALLQRTSIPPENCALMESAAFRTESKSMRSQSIDVTFASGNSSLITLKAASERSDLNRVHVRCRDHPQKSLQDYLRLSMTTCAPFFAMALAATKLRRKTIYQKAARKTRYTEITTPKKGTHPVPEVHPVMRITFPCALGRVFSNSA